MTDVEHRTYARRGDARPKKLDIDGSIFTCHASVPGAVFMDLADPDGTITVGRYDDFFRAVMPADEYNRFQAFIREPENGVDLEMLVAIMTDLVDAYRRPQDGKPGLRIISGEE